LKSILHHLAFIGLLLLSFSPCLHGQKSTVNFLFQDESDGLSHRDVESIQQDSFGRLWLGTKIGLDRFDGHSFKHFLHKSNPGIPEEVNHIYVDKAADFWLLNTGSVTNEAVEELAIFDPIAQKVIPLEEKYAALPGLLRKGMYRFFQSQKGEICCFSGDLKHIYHFQGDSIRTYASPMPGSKPTAVTEIQNGQFAFVFAALEGPLTLVIADSLFNDKWTHTFSEDVRNVLVSQPYGAAVPLVITFAGTHWETKHWYKVVDSLQPIETNGMESIQAFTAFQDRQLRSAMLFFHALPDKTYLLYTDGQYNIFDLQKSLFSHVEMNHDQEAFCRGIFVDRFENIWAASQFGFALFDIRPSIFTRLLYNEDNRMIENVTSRSFQVLNGDLYVANNLPNKLIRVPKIDSIIKYHRSAEEYHVLDSTGAHSVAFAKDEKGFLYFYRLGELFRYDPMNERRKKLAQWPLSTGQERSPIWSMYFDQANRLLAGNESGQIGVYEKNGAFSVIELDDVQHPFVYQFLPYQNQLWVITSKGIFVLNEKSLEVEARYDTEGKAEFKLIEDGFRYAYIDQNETMWLATSSHGLMRWHLPTNEQKLFSTENGFPENDIYAVYEDSNNRLWIPGTNGIIVFDKLIHFSEVFGVEDGISHPEFNRLSHTRLPDGHLIFGGLNGMTLFHPDSIKKSNYLTNTPIMISSVHKFEGDSGKIISLPLNPAQKMTVIMSSDDPFFTIEVAALNYSNLNQIKYAYQFIGEKNQWVIQDDPTITMTRLPYGDHQLKVKAILADGSWSENEVSLKICVLKPFYLQTWFYGLILFAIVMSIVGLYLLRTKELMKNEIRLRKEVKNQTNELRKVNQIISAQSDKMKEMDLAKTNFFANISHELRTPLTLISGPIKSVLLKSNLTDRDRMLLTKAHTHSKSLLAQINEIMDLTKLENGKMEYRASPVALYHAVKKLIESFESYAELKNIQMELLYMMDKKIIVMVDKRKFERILSNLLSNALKFTPELGKVRIELSEQQGKVLIAVIDSGKGIHPSEVPHVFERYYQAKQGKSPALHGTGIGLAMAQEYARLFEGEITLKSILGQGSRFTFNFPLVEAINVPSDVPAEPEIPFRSTAMLRSMTSVPSALEKHTVDAPRILIVEDNVQLQSFLQFILSEKYQVITAANGIQALEKLRSEHADLIISDVMMPEMDGIELLEKLKSDLATYQIPVMMLTAKTSLENKLQALRIGVDDYLLKPFDEEELFARIENLLKNYASRQKLFEEPKPIVKEPRKQPHDAQPMPQEDLDWLKLVEETMISNLGKMVYNLDHLAMDVHVSRSQLNRRVKQLTGMTPSAYMLEVRLQMVRQMLENGKVTTVKEAIYNVGIKETKHFSRQFKNRFGKSPSAFLDMSA
jgi:signal transduction histidine kinase/DNA-binding response OmpR family regulator